MAGHLVQLTAASRRNALRHDAPDRQGAIAAIATIAVLGAVALGLVAIAWGRDPQLRGAIAVVAGTLAALAAFAVPVAARTPDPVDPRAFVMAGRTPERAARDSLVAACLGVGPLMLAIALLASIALWRDDLVALAFAAVGSAVSFGMFVVLGRLGALVGGVSAERRVAGDVAAAAWLVGLLAASPVVFVLVTAPWQAGAGTVLRLVGDALAWSPFGGSWAAAATAAGSGPLAAGAQLAISIVALGVLVVAWRALGSRHAAGQLGRRRVTGELMLGLVGRLGRTPAGAVAARTVTYWLRDRRYRVVLATVILVPVLALVPLGLAGVPAPVLALVPVPLLGFFFGWALHNDLAFDSTALWLHITASMDGRSDRFGRALPTLIVGGALIVLGSIATALITGEWWWALSVLGVAACLLGAAAGISSVTSVVAPYPVARPGDSPFAQPVRSWGPGIWIHPLTGLVAFVAASPAVALGIVGIVTDIWWWHVAALVVGVVVGAGVLAWGIGEGGRRYDERSSELMTFATSA